MTLPHPLDTSAAADPRAAYGARLADRRGRVEALRNDGRRVADRRLLVFVAGCVMAGFAFGRDGIPAAWLLLPAAAFAYLVVRHARVHAALAKAEGAVTWYEWALARLDGGWEAHGDAGDRYRDPEHPYAEHLDVVGPRSLYHRLCTARTPAGRDTLAAWLLGPAAPETLRGRQRAAADLAPRLDLREDLALLGAEVEEGCDAGVLSAWGAAPRDLPGGVLRVLVVVAPCVAVVALIGWLAGVLSGWVFLGAVLGEVVVWRTVRERVERVLGAGDLSHLYLDLLGKLLGRLERAGLEAPLLLELQASLRGGGDAPSVRIARLDRLVELADGERNQFFAPIALLLLWRAQFAYAVEAWRLRNGPALERWQRVVGEFEALAALGAHTFERPDETFPDVSADGPLLEAEGLGHPLLPEAACVRNDVALGDPRRAYIVSGSNMSGKSTLLRAVGVAVVLAQAGAPVRAGSLRMAPLRIGASIRVSDSLQDGASRFYAEVRHVGRVAGLVREQGPPVLFLLDEIFHGTNSHDRRIGAGAVLSGLVERGAVGLMTTHDLALARIADDLPGRVENVHFEDQLVDGLMSFDYRMRPGVVQKSNALELMRSVGLDV